jgi:O-acetyl-ADP-ribose deacetylase (regulator of RNase III)
MAYPKLNPDKALIWRILHRDNLPWVLDHGLHCGHSAQRSTQWVSIGQPELISKRGRRPVPCPPHGVLNDYVPFYFTPFSVMLYNILTGQGGVPRRGPEEIVILVSSLHRVHALGLPFVFTDMHAYYPWATFHTDLARLDGIDWPLLQRRDFRRDPDDPARFERYQAEALVFPMITYTHGNLLEARAEALVNTVNTVGVMGKGIALMFRERFEANFRRYAAACKVGEVQTGRMFVTEPGELDGPRWIVNFPTKQHWRAPSRLEWVESGLQDLRRFLVEHRVASVAIPPLGAGNGGLDWPLVRGCIERALGDLESIDIQIYAPAGEYQNVAKRSGVERLTPARALIAELIRRYWVLGVECSLLEIQKLAWFLERSIEHLMPQHNPLRLQFTPNRYGPYAHRLTFVLNDLEAVTCTATSASRTPGHWT